MKVVGYFNLKCINLVDLERAVRAHIANGWEPQGSVIFANSHYIQTMVKREEDEPVCVVSDMRLPDSVEELAQAFGAFQAEEQELEERKIVDYCVVVSNFTLELVKLVVCKLNDGWELYGCPDFKLDSAGMWHSSQAMVKYKE